LAKFIAVCTEGSAKLSINMDQVKYVEITDDQIKFHFGPDHVVPLQGDQMGKEVFTKLVNKLLTDIPQTSWS
jgi:hypothetical protein